MKKLLLASLGVICVTTTSSFGAIANTASNSAATSGYTLDLRIDNSANWTANSPGGQFRYGNDNFTSGGGNLMFATDTGNIGLIDVSNGTVTSRASAGGGVRGFAQSGNNYLAAGNAGVSGNVYTNATWTTVSPTAADVGRESIHTATISGTDYVFGLTSARDQVTRKVVNADGTIGATSWTSADLGARVRGMTYVPGIGLYVTQNSSDGTPMLQLINDSGSVSTITGFGTSTWNLTEAVAHANIGGNDYLFLAATPMALADPNGVMIGLLDGSGAVTSWDFYQGYDFFSGNTGALALWADSSNLYWSEGNSVKSFSLSIAAVPEPHEYGLMAIGSIVLLIALRRRKAQAVAVQA